MVLMKNAICYFGFQGRNQVVGPPLYISTINNFSNEVVEEGDNLHCTIYAA